MNIDAYVIRKADIQDAEGIAQVHVKSWQHSYAGIIDPQFLKNINYEQRLRLRKDRLQSSSSLQLVASFENKVVGFADIGIFRADPRVDLSFTQRKKTTPIGEIYAIYLLGEHQGQGIGKALFAKCWQCFHGQDIDTFVLWALKDNTRARKFYEKQGGEIVGEETIKIGDEEFLDYCYKFAVSGSIFPMVPV